jgi:phosphoserine phosphatase RsbU/P
MVPPDPVVSAQDVLQAFRRDAPDLFLGAAFITVGLVAIAFSALSKKRDALLIYFGIFAALYGLRLWIQPRVFGIALAHPDQFQVPHAEFFKRLRSGISYLIPIPLVLYFRCAGFLITRAALAAAYLLVIIEIALAVAAFGFGARPFYDVVNNIAVIAALAILIVQFVTTAQPTDKHIVVIRRGLLIFAAFVPAALIASMVKLAAASQRAVASDPAQFLLGI